MSVNSIDNRNLSLESNVIIFDDVKAKCQFRYFPVLDGMRGIAILLVMIYHSQHLIPDLHKFVKGCFLGVDIFFVLSGFLITSVLLKENDRTGQINLKNFYIRRFCRLIPAYWAFLICLYLFGSQILPETELEPIYGNYNFVYAFLYLMNWNQASGGVVSNLIHTWSLAIEEQFYILWSLILYLAFSEKRSRRQIFLITFCLATALILWRCVRVLWQVDVDILYFSTESRIDALLIGSMASMIYFWSIIPKSFFSSPKFSWLTCAAGINIVWILFSFSNRDPFLYFGMLSLFSLSTAII